MIAGRLLSTIKTSTRGSRRTFRIPAAVKTTAASKLPFSVRQNMSLTWLQTTGQQALTSEDLSRLARDIQDHGTTVLRGSRSLATESYPMSQDHMNTDQETLGAQRPESPRTGRVHQPAATDRTGRICKSSCGSSNSPLPDVASSFSRSAGDCRAQAGRSQAVSQGQPRGDWRQTITSPDEMTRANQTCSTSKHTAQARSKHGTQRKGYTQARVLLCRVPRKGGKQYLCGPNGSCSLRQAARPKHTTRPSPRAVNWAD